MADAGIKKVIVPFSELPAIDQQSFTYNIRYRIISEDKNRFSHWSRIYNINASTTSGGDPLINPYTWNYVKETVAVSSGTTTGIRLSWSITPGYIVPSILNAFDIFVSRNGASYEFLATTTAQTFTVLRESTETSIQIKVQAPTYPKEENATAQLFETTVITVP